MLPSHIEENEKYSFVSDSRNGFHIYLATQEILNSPSGGEALWGREAANEQSFRALIRWAGVRRSRWQEWGRLGEALGREALYHHMRSLMEAEPPAESVGAVIQRGDDPRETVVGEMMHGSEGVCFEELYRHRFLSRAVREKFHDFLVTDQNYELAHSLVQIAYSQGTAALGEVLDEIAMGDAKPTSRAERRRKQKASPKIAA